MEATGPGPRIDARSVRFELGAVAVLLLGGYVFGVLWVIPGLAVLLAIGLGFGARVNPFARLYQVIFAERLRPATATEAATDVRFFELFAVVALSLATLMFAAHLNGLAWLIALVEAGICALHAGTGLSVEAALRDRLTGRKRG
jgi:Domain of unknown function (DUF4395)